MEGVIFSTFVVVFREALEASLILGIVLTVLLRLSAKRYISHVVLSAALATLASLAAGFWLAGVAQSNQETASALIEAGISLLASAVLTYMFFWMEKQARRLKSEIETHMETALSKGDYLAIVSLPFFAVLREGAETVLFLKAVAIQSGGGASWIGGTSGLFLALSITALIFVFGKRISLKPLFRFTGVVILVIAAGLLAYGVHEFNEIGWIPPVVEPMYNLNLILNEKKGLGSFLKALFGYNGNPSLTELIAYWLYWAGILFTLTRSGKVDIIKK